MDRIKKIKTRTATITLRCRPEEKAAAAESAAVEGLTLTDFILKKCSQSNQKNKT
jgi:uncharacterized protein (DUF1778 family)